MQVQQGDSNRENNIRSMELQQLPIHFAPLQGYTEAFYRNAHATVFGGIDT